MFYEGINTKVFRRIIAFAITLVVTSRSSSFKYTMSVHAVHASAERSVCNIVVSIHFKYILAGNTQTRPDTYICSASAQKAELKVVGVLEVRTWSGAGVSVLVCTQGAAIEMDWW